MPSGLHQANLFRYLMQLFPHGIKKVHIFSSIVVLQRLKSTKLFTSSRDAEYFMWVVKPLIFQMVFWGTLYSNLASKFDSNTIPSPHHEPCPFSREWGTLRLQLEYPLLSGAPFISHPNYKVICRTSFLVASGIQVWMEEHLSFYMPWK